jgi:osomolarity two-component system sensor histidine kinase SLN1
MLLWGDKNRILQVIINLTSNSLKFTPTGGSVRVIVRCVGELESSLSRRGSVMSKQNSLSKQNSGRNSRQRMYSGGSEAPSESSVGGKIATATANEINVLDRPQHAQPLPRQLSPPLGTRDLVFEFEVIDTGPGVPEEIQERVFEPFFQGDMALSKKYQGTGLGLSICSQLAKLMGGSMSVKSEEGYGSTFTMRMPLKHIGSRADSTSSSLAGSSIRFNSPRNSLSGDQRPDFDDKASVRSFPASSQTQSVGTSSQYVGEHSSPVNRIASLSHSPPSPTKQMADMASATAMDKRAFDHGRSLKILVAEDNKMNQVVVTRLLKMEKIFDVTIAEGTSHSRTFGQEPTLTNTVDGQIAYEVVMASMDDTRNFDLIFMDVQVEVHHSSAERSKTN